MREGKEITNLVEKYGLTNLPEKPPQELGERLEEVLVLGQKYIQEQDWKSLGDLASSFPENDSLVTQTNLLKILHDGLCQVPVQIPEYYNNMTYYEAEAGQDTLNCATAIVKKMGNNPDLLPYLRAIVEQNNIPEVVLEEGQAAVNESLNAGADGDSDVRWFYYRAVCEAVLHTPIRESYEVVAKILEKIDQQIGQKSQKEAAYSEIMAKSYPVEIGSGAPQSLEDQFKSQYQEAESNMPSDIVAGIWSNDLAVDTKCFIIKKLRDAKQPEAVSILLDLLKNEGPDAPIYFHPILEALKNYDQNLIAAKLLSLGQSSDQYEKRSALWLLYRLELGKIGMSAEGVNYLGRLYDLGEFNHPEYFARRLTPQGDIGVFDNRNRLSKRFNLGNLADGRKNIATEVLDISDDLLFSRHPFNERDAARRRQIMAEFKNAYANFYNQDFFQKTGLQANNFSFAEQGWFMHFNQSADEATKQRLYDFAKTFGENGVRAFISMQFGDELGPKILSIGEKFKGRTAKVIFAKYADMVDKAGEVNQSLAGHFASAEEEEKATKAIIHEILEKATLLLRHIWQESERTQDLSQVTKQVEAFRSEVALYVSVIEELRKERKITLQDEIEKNTVTRKGGEFTEEEKDEMCNIFAFGRAETFPEELRKQSMLEFKHKIEDKDHTFYLFKHEGKIVAFLHTDPVRNNDGGIKDNAIYVGSLNVGPEGRGSALGVIFTQYFLEKYGEDNDIYADVLEANSRALNFYTKFLGFKQRQDQPFSMIPGENNTEFKNINIIRDMRPQARAMAA
jgi:ribosomal protein S18 acetylase RimI-like enzyme